MSHGVALAFGVFAIFLFHALIFRVGAKDAPLRVLGKNHLLFGLLYLGGAFFLKESRAEKIVGLYIYFILQYPFFFVFFGQISRGFSLNLCVSAFRKGGRISVSEVLQNYGDGRGVAYVKADRLKVMIESGVARERSGRIELTWRGKFVVAVNRLILNSIGIDYLGVEKQ